MNWYNKWFGTHYYDLLYNQRDEQEAKSFLDQLIKYLKPSSSNCFLDLACGKGRHSVYLNSCGYDVTGIDLSPQNIEHCKQFENPHLHFYVHDMRRILSANSFNYILNLFTSFGYFERSHHNQLAISAAAAALKSQGILVIDFFNAVKVMNNLVPYHKKKIQHLEFEISKKMEHNYIIKTIKVTDDNAEKFFYEKVQALTLNDFERFLTQANLSVVDLFGDYQLNNFDAQNSDRLIIIAQKK
ncbi:MAG: class I SAM-dependent methyltransferase [Bacteroidia bacterium]